MVEHIKIPLWDVYVITRDIVDKNYDVIPEQSWIRPINEKSINNEKTRLQGKKYKPIFKSDVNLHKILLIDSESDQINSLQGQLIHHIEFIQYMNGTVNIHIYYFDDSYLSSSLYSGFTELTYGTNEVIIQNVDVVNASMFINNVLFPLYESNINEDKINEVFSTNITKARHLARRGIEYALKYIDRDPGEEKMEKLIYTMVTKKDIKFRSDIFKLLLFSDFNQAMSYLDKHIEVLPSFIDIVYYELQDTRYYQIMHEKINKVIIDDKLLSKFKDDEINKMYYVLAQIIYNSSTDLSDDVKIAVLEYLYNSGDYADAKELRQRISLGIMGYGINETPGVEINLDIPTLYFLMKKIAELKILINSLKK